MFRLIVVSCVIAACAAQQNVDPKNARILKEQRFNAGDGRNGAAFATEDGHIFREETDNNGNRIGQYSYIGDDGQTYTVRYSAGKDGFRILSGDHVPSSGQDAALFNAEEAGEQVEVRASLPAAPAPVAPAVVDYDYYNDEAAPVDPNFNPFINPHDPTHRNFQFNQNAATFNPESPAARQASQVPNCADCAGVNPFVNPFDASHQQGGVLAGHLAGHLAGQPQPAPRRQAPLPVAPVQPIAPAVRPSPVPKRFFPPGQLKLNRFETGFNFDFES